MAVLVGAGVASSAPALGAPGDHIRAGEVTLIPSIAAGLQYHTNVYRSELASTPAASFGLTPGGSAAAAGDDHQFSASAEWTLDKYLFVGDNGLESTLSSGDRVKNLDRFDQFHVGGGADLFKLNRVGLRLADDMNQRNWVMDSPSANVPYTSQFRNELVAGLRVNPGPALELVPGFEWTYDLYRKADPTEDKGEGDRKLNNRQAFGPKLDAKWAFLPRTALVAHVTYEHSDWNHNTIPGGTADSEVGTQLDVPNSDFVRMLAGIDGRFTEKLFLQGFVGYGFGIFAVVKFSSGEANASGGGTTTTTVTAPTSPPTTVLPIPGAPPFLQFWGAGSTTSAPPDPIPQ